MNTYMLTAALGMMGDMPQVSTGPMDGYPRTAEQWQRVREERAHGAAAARAKAEAKRQRKRDANTHRAGIDKQ